MAATYDARLTEMRNALSSIIMPMEEWQKQWMFDFQAEFQSGTEATSRQ
jgi:DNA-binding HxlR family transcriptional regulator